MRHSRIYFSHYGEVYSLSKEDAQKLATDALDPNQDGYNIENYSSCKMLRRPEVSREAAGFYQNKSWKEVHFCLDWTNSDWAYFLQSLVSEK